MSGTIGVLSGDLSRYANFSMALLHVQTPTEDWRVCWEQGCDITANSNGLVRFARRTNSDYLWILGDDHVFSPDILLRLLAHDVDVIVPHCLQRSAPFAPVVYEGQDENDHHILHTEIPSSGLFEVYAAGTAGMLVKKRVLDAIPDPVFETHGGQNEDLTFCRKIREAGFKLYCDADAAFGHIGSMISWPTYDEEHGWSIKLDIGPPQGGVPQQVFLRRFSATSLTPA